MWNMVMKDLYLQRMKMMLLVVAGLMVGSMFFSTGLGGGGLYPAVPVFILAITYLFTMYSCYHEDKNKSMSFLRSLPVPARVVVNSKFAAVIVLEATVLIPIFFLLCLGGIAGIPAVSAFIALSLVILTGLVVLLFNSIVLFSFFRWGYNEMRWAYFVIFFGSMLLGRIVPKLPVFFPQISPQQGVVLGAALVLLMVFLCWKGSISGLSKKDLT